ncbi:MAG: hypothetical protein MK101_08135 [Phycisphaerales bacterium]|nr:hypothetical protein [Phycisphaerales bacterium]
MLSMTASGGPVTLTPPDFDRWNYPFNASPGNRSVGSTFSSYGSGYDFDDRDGQVLIGWLSDDVAEPDLPAWAYDLTSCTVRITLASDDVPFDPTVDGVSTHEPDGDPDTDLGRASVLSTVGFRNGWDGWTFGESGPYGETMTSGTRNCFAADLDADGQLRDISNSLTEGFQPNVFAVGWVDGVEPGEIIPQWSVLEFQVNLDSPEIRCHLQRALADGLLEFALTSLHAAAEPGGGGGPSQWPDWVLKDHALVGMGVVDAASLTIDVQVSEPSGVPGDITGDGQVNVDDLLRVLESFGPCPCCPADLDESGAVTVDDLLMIISYWGN